MASVKESGLTSPTSVETVDRKQPKAFSLRPGQYSLNTTIQLTCDSHKDKKAAASLSGDFKVTYREGAGFSKWEDFRPCELAGCLVTSETSQSSAVTVLCIGALQQALGSAAQLKFSLQCGHEVVPECSTCAPPVGSGLSRVNASCQTYQGVSSQQVQDDSSDSTSEPIATPTESSTMEQDMERQATMKRDLPPFALWFPYEKKTKKTILPQLEIETVQKDPPAKEEPESKPEVAGPPAEQDATAGKMEQLRSADEAAKAHKMSKEVKAQRAAALAKQKEDKLKAHAEELEDIMEEIEHQKAVLRARRDEKRQQTKMAGLRKKLQKLVSQESEDADYTSSSSDSETEDEAGGKPSSSSSSSSSGEHVVQDDNKAGTANESCPEKVEEGKEPEDDPNAWEVPRSKAKEEWEKAKAERDQNNPFLDEIMDMVGLEAVKTKMLEVKSLVDTANRQGVDLTKERFHMLLTGNPGTGKTRVATLYAHFLASLGLVDDNVAHTTGARLVCEGVHEVKSLLGGIDSRGVVVVDDAHHLRPAQSSTGRKVLDFVTAEMDRLQGDVVFILTGHGKAMESLLGHNQGLQSRAPFAVKFADYDDAELHEMLVQKLHDKFGASGGGMRVEKGERGLYMRIVARRLGRGRGAPSFGNAREVENTLLRILFRQAARLERSRQAQQQQEAVFDDMLLTMEDVVGPPPSAALEGSAAWQGLQGMVGLGSVKASLRALVHRLQVNYDRELAEKPVVECPLNRIFLGNPGTGKTTVAQYYGQIMVDMGLLSNGEVVVKNPSDFVGEYLGESENITKGILAASRGKVLIIDEAYALSDRSDENNERSCGNIYKTAIVDTLVAQIQGTVNEDRVVLLLGYKDRMERMFQAVNPGLGRRFPMSAAFEFDDFSDDELRQILDRKLDDQGYTASDQAKGVAMEVLTRARSHRNFGNAGEIDILLSKAKELQQGRLAEMHNARVAATAVEAAAAATTTTDSLITDSESTAEGTKTAITTEKEYDPLMLEPQDIDPDFDRANVAESRIRDSFKDFVGADDIVEKLVGYSRIVQSTKALDIDPREQIPFNYLFRGPPGTGKTTTAKRIGQVFYDMGLLATNQVYDCSATDLIGEYKGHTGPKTQKVFQRALGKVLFIDEAYRLNDDGFGKEALVEMLNLLTKNAYRDRVVTVLAGYDDDINALLRVNPGLGSRFPEVLQFAHLTPPQCHELLVRRLGEQKLDAAVLVARPGSKVADRLRGSFARLAALPDWGNARDVEALAKAVLGRMLREKSAEKPSLVVKEDTVDAEVEAMIAEREQRAGNSCPVSHIYL